MNRALQAQNPKPARRNLLEAGGSLRRGRITRISVLLIRGRFTLDKNLLAVECPPHAAALPGDRLQPAQSHPIITPVASVKYATKVLRHNPVQVRGIQVRSSRSKNDKWTSLGLVQSLNSRCRRCTDRQIKAGFIPTGDFILDFQDL